MQKPPLQRNTANEYRTDTLNWPDAKATLLDARLWFHYVAYLLLGVGVSSMSLFAPTIVAGLGYKNLHAQLFTVPPYVVAYAMTMAAGILSDRKKIRGVVAGVSFSIGFVAFTIQGRSNCVAVRGTK